MTSLEEHELVDAMICALKALDIGDCDSGGDYHSSAIGRHSTGSGNNTCPACKLRTVLEKYRIGTK